MIANIDFDHSLVFYQFFIISLFFYIQYFLSKTKKSENQVPNLGTVPNFWELFQILGTPFSYTPLLGFTRDKHENF